jgi:hypothetical protein
MVFQDLNGFNKKPYQKGFFFLYVFTSFVGFDPESNQGVVVLTNSLNTVDDIGIWLLEHGH